MILYKYRVNESTRGPFPFGAGNMNQVEAIEVRWLPHMLENMA